MMRCKNTVDDRMLSVQLLEPGANNASEIRQDFWQVVGQQGAKSANESHSFRSARVEPVKAVPVSCQ